MNILASVVVHYKYNKTNRTLSNKDMITEYIHLAKSLAYLIFLVLMLQSLHSNCEILNINIIYRR